MTNLGTFFLWFCFAVFAITVVALLVFAAFLVISGVREKLRERKKEDTDVH